MDRPSPYYGAPLRGRWQPEGLTEGGHGPRLHKERDPIWEKLS